MEILRVCLSAENGDPCLGIINSKCRIPARPVVQQSSTYLPSTLKFSLRVIRKVFISLSPQGRDSGSSPGLWVRVSLALESGYLSK